MRRLGSVLPALALVALLSGCGGSDDQVASDSDPSTDTPASAATGTPTSPSSSGGSASTDSTDYDVVAMLTETGAGGQLGQAAVLSDPAALAAYQSDFTADAMRQRLDEVYASTQPPEGTVLYASVVAIGCDEPTDVTVTADRPGGLDVQAVKVPSPKLECFAPMTTVAVLTVPADAVS